MSTIKPLDIYIGQTKVFPDVNLDALDSPIIGSSTFSNLNTSANYILTQHNANISNISNLSNKSIIVPYVDDTDSSDFHTNSSAEDNYWNFNWGYQSTSTMEIMFDINAKWLRNAIDTEQGCTFAHFGGTSITFKEGTILTPRTMKFNGNIPLKENQDAVVNNFCTNMFSDSNNLTAIYNLDLTGSTYFDTTEDIHEYYLYEAVTGNTPWGDNIGQAYSGMFNGCSSLTTLDVTWPTYLYADHFDNMFSGCESLPDNQIPTLKLRPTNLHAFGVVWDFFDIKDIFNTCRHCNSLHIDNDSWTYVRKASHAWENTNVSQIDIPATATKLINIDAILGGYLHSVRDEIQQKDDYSADKYIIRTTAPMTAVLNSVEDASCGLFDFNNYDSNQDFLDTFGGIYVPDAQVQDWKDFITNTGASNIATNCVFGLSDL